MEINEFGRLLAIETKNRLGEGFDAEYKEVQKNNNVTYHGILMKNTGSNIAPTIYIDSLYRDFENGRSLEELAECMVTGYRENEPTGGFDMSDILDFSKVSDKLTYKLVNFKKNEELLSDVPCKRLQDLAVVPVCVIPNHRGERGTITIRDSLLESWEISKEELWENVFLAAPSVSPASVTELGNMLEDIGFPDTDEQLTKIYVVTNEYKCFGAGVFLYPGILGKLSEEHESDLYIIPSSVHETLIVPAIDGTDPMALKTIIGEVNRECVCAEDILSDNLYIYERDAEKIRICG